MNSVVYYFGTGSLKETEKDEINASDLSAPFVIGFRGHLRFVTVYLLGKEPTGASAIHGRRTKLLAHLNLARSLREYLLRFLTLECCGSDVPMLLYNTIPPLPPRC